MPVHEAALNTTLTNDADFRAVSQAIHNALLACGLSATADTGQVDLTTAPRPAAGVYAGYKTYSRNDASQAANPIIMKVEYGAGGSAAVIQTRTTFGRATNGAGTFVGAVSTALALVVNPGPGTLYASSDEAGTWLFFTSATASAEFGFGVDRLRDVATGAVNDGAWIGFAGSTGLTVYRYSPIAGTFTAGVNSSLSMLDLTGSIHVGAKLADIQIAPVIVYHGRLYAAGIAGYKDGEIPVGLFDAEFCGATRGFRALGHNAPYPSASLTSFPLAMRWEVA